MGKGGKQADEGCFGKRGQIDARVDSRTAGVNVEGGRVVVFEEANERGNLSSLV